MRFFKFAAVSLVMIFFLMLGIAISDAYAGNYLGEFCWQDEEGGITKLAVTDMGNGHFLLNGIWTGDEGEIGVVHGNAEIVGDKVYITITNVSSGEYGICSWMGLCILELATLNGNHEGLSIYYDRASGEIDLDYNSGTLTFIPCPE
ncbi:secreted protein [Candidatus Desulfofervidus auxilii]|uniref:Secreted protein n=1 Tax=Desulfofervidus auxilii TaxID=1621989 RepID=A0A7U4QKL8_DESA2|nr:hypothetical protein [Candidatus Desulfofervidus auxilii]AMM41092.1 secreted protein [Candidatus Desulfofervidus auxilii]